MLTQSRFVVCHVWSTVIGGLLLFLILPAALAFPIMQVPAGHLAVHGTYPNAQQKSDRCAKFWEELEPLLRDIKAANESKNYDRIKPALLGKAYAQASALLREGDALKNMGETAGVDWSIRGELARVILSDTIAKMMGTKAGNDLAKKASQYAVRTDKKRIADIAKIKKLFSQKKIDEAETAVNQLMYDVDTFYLWVSPQEQQGIAGQTRSVLDELSRVHAEIRPVRRKQLGMEAIKHLGLNVGSLVRSAETAALEIRADGKTSLDGNSLEGHAAFELLARQWLEARKKYLHSLGYSVMLENVWDSNCNAALGVEPIVNDWKVVDTELTKRMSAALVKIIDSDAARAKTSDLPTTYQAYLAAVSGLAIELDDAKFAAQCEAALSALAKQDPAFSSRVENYQRATSDWLYWRNRLAVSQARGRQQRATPVLDQADTQNLFPQLRNSLAECLTLLQPKLGSETEFSSAFTKAGRTGSTLDNRIWFSTTDPLPAGPVDPLQKELYATGSPAWSLAAVMAIDSARAGRFERVGGQVTAIVPHAMSTRFVQLEEDANSFCPPSKVPGVPPGLDHVLLEVQVKPEWIQHRYFFVDLKK